MTYYLDTSVLVPIFLDEPRSVATRTWIRTRYANVVIADFTGLEFSAVVTRAFRTGAIPEGRVREIFADIDLLRRDCLSHVHSRRPMRCILHRR